MLNFIHTRLEVVVSEEIKAKSVQKQPFPQCQKMVLIEKRQKNLENNGVGVICILTEAKISPKFELSV